MHALIQLNYDFGRMELAAERAETREDSAAFFARHLHPDLVFRRAGGGIVGKEAYLSGLTAEGNYSEGLSSYVLEVTETDDGKAAEVLVLVDLKGQRGGKDATGAYRNRRLFVRVENGDWQCLAWFNSRVQPK